MITPEDIILDSRNIDGLLAMPKPSTAADLDHFNSAIDWIRVGSPDYTELTASIQEFLTKQKGLHGCRKSQLAKRIMTPELWTLALQKNFQEIKDMITNSVKFCHL